jgi:hypothetical protein
MLELDHTRPRKELYLRCDGFDTASLLSSPLYTLKRSKPPDFQHAACVDSSKGRICPALFHVLPHAVGLDQHILRISRTKPASRSSPSVSRCASRSISSKLTSARFLFYGSRQNWRGSFLMTYSSPESPPATAPVAARTSAHRRTLRSGMFERFSRPALRVLFWARAEAGRLGSDWIEPEHLLLGVLAEDQRDWARAIPTLAGERSIGFDADPTPSPAQFFTADSASKLRQILTASAGTPKPDAVDMPLAKRSKQVLAATAKRAEGGTIGLLHILWGLLSNADNSVSAGLKSVGVTVDQVEDAIRNRQP